jgi:hypothetical protein
MMYFYQRGVHDKSSWPSITFFILSYLDTSHGETYLSCKRFVTYSGFNKAQTLTTAVATRCQYSQARLWIDIIPVSTLQPDRLRTANDRNDDSLLDKCRSCD